MSLASYQAADRQLDQILGDSVHRALVVLRFEQVPVTVHRDLQGAVPGEGLHGLRAEPRLDPARDREMPQRMPVEARGWLRVLARSSACNLASRSNSGKNLRFTMLSWLVYQPRRLGKTRSSGSLRLAASFHSFSAATIGAPSGMVRMPAVVLVTSPSP